MYKARTLHPIEKTKGFVRGFDKAEGLENGCLGEWGGGAEEGLESGRPSGGSVDEPGHGSGFLCFGWLGITRFIFLWFPIGCERGRDGGSGKWRWLTEHLREFRREERGGV